MRSLKWVVALLSCVLMVSTASARPDEHIYTSGKPYVVKGPVAGSGQIDLFLTDIRLFRLNRVKVVLEGHCNSSRTLFTALLKDGLLCARPGTMLGFHEYVEVDNQKIEGNIMLSYRVRGPLKGYKLRKVLNYYPEHVLSAVNKAGGFPPHKGPLLKISAKRLGIPAC